MKELMGQPNSLKGTIFAKPKDPTLEANAANPAWKCGASLSVVLINCKYCVCASTGDSRVVAHTINNKEKGGKQMVNWYDLSRDHRTSGKHIQD